MKTSEKYLVAVLLFLVAFGGIGLYGAFPLFDSIQKKLNTTHQRENEIKAFETAVNALNMQVFQYQKMKELPPGLRVREFQPETYERNIKEMIDQVITLATDNGNDLISLKPIAEEIAPTPPAPGKTPPAIAPNTAKPRDPNTTPGTQSDILDDANKVLKTYTYELVIRGAYDSINGFLRSMNHHNEVIEIKSINMVNETGENRDQGTENTLANPLKPLKLTSCVVLFLENTTPSN